MNSSQRLLRELNRSTLADIHLPDRLVPSPDMRILVLGGTRFVGHAIVEAALCSGAEVTLFGRGRTGPGLFPHLTRLLGDRDTDDYAALRDRTWDAVVDVSGYVPRHVAGAMDAATHPSEQASPQQRNTPSW